MLNKTYVTRYKGVESWRTHLAFLGLLLVFMMLTLMSRSTLNDHLLLFLCLMGVANGILFGFFGYLQTSGKDISAFYVWWGAVLIHCLAILGQPMFEDDYFRYLWDAYHTMHYGSPYGIAPSEYFDQNTVPEVFHSILGQINYPDIATVYGPVQQYSFLLAYLIEPGAVWPLQLIYSVADMALIAVLMRLSTPRIVMLYAWNPLVFKEILLTAHPDGLGVLWLMLSVLFYFRGTMSACVVCLAASIGSKVFAILLVPFLMLKAKRQHWMIFILALIIIYTPLYLGGQSDLPGLMAMTNDWEFNSLIFGIVSIWLDPLHAKILLGTCLLLILGGYWLSYVQHHKRANALGASVPAMPYRIPNIRGDWVIGLFLLCAPVINPWYLLWLLPFGVMYPSYTVWTASAVIVLAYVTGLNLDSETLGPYDQPMITRIVQMVAIMVALYLDLKRKGLPHRSLSTVRAS